MQIQTKGDVVVLRDDTVKVGWESWVCLMTDVHYDSVKCDVKQFTRDLDEARRKDALLMIGGDLFDAMQGRDDPRRDPEQLKAQYKVSSYYDALVMDMTEYLLQYKELTMVLAMGNHETSVLKINSTNLIDRLAYALSTQGGKAFAGGYAGWARFMFQMGNSNRQSFRLFRHHGAGGGAIMSFGTLDTRRQGSYIDADIIWNGHNHQAYYVPIAKIGLNDANNIDRSLVHYVRTPGYKISGLESNDRYGFDIEKHPAPTPRGCAFIRFYCDSVADGVQIEIQTRIH